MIRKSDYGLRFLWHCIRRSSLPFACAEKNRWKSTNHRKESDWRIHNCYTRSPNNRQSVCADCRCNSTMSHKKNHGFHRWWNRYRKNRWSNSFRLYVGWSCTGCIPKWWNDSRNHRNLRRSHHRHTDGSGGSCCNTPTHHNCNCRDRYRCLQVHRIRHSIHTIRSHPILYRYSTRDCRHSP